MRASKQIINRCCVVCIPNTWIRRKTTFIKADISAATLRSPFLFLPSSLLPLFPMSAVWHQSLQRRGACNRSFLSPSSFILSSTSSLSLDYSTIITRTTSSFQLNLAVKYWVKSKWTERQRESNTLAFLYKTSAAPVCVDWFHAATGFPLDFYISGQIKWSLSAGPCIWLWPVKKRSFATL